MVSIHFYGHSAVKISNKMNVIIDPGKWYGKMLVPSDEKADIILVTHTHSDHLGNAAELSIKNKAIVVAPRNVIDEVAKSGAPSELMKIIKPRENISYKGIKIEAHELTHGPKLFPFSRQMLGFTIFLSGKSFVHLGDAASLENVRRMNCDILFVPIGGFVTFDLNHAVEAVSIIKPKIAIPIHARTPISSSKPQNFVDLVEQRYPDVNVMILKPGTSVEV